MAPSASKQKRLAEKAAKGSASTGKTGSSTPAASTNGNSTPMTSLSANGSEENLADAAAEMKKLNLATDRSAVSLSWTSGLFCGLRADCMRC
jgi:ATP-binding cassette subfamily F protein 2